ncbi:HK97-gp10 family putative phage morphogenesis protein [Ketogulonicigenium vulgare]|uniref:HK97-gp10 family putative phage morphogenesis protein n=1 Tax=Ketogulonicigenium vulgare TaxID=92945 RepID=UPI00235A2545|nr:HK97-gp10 family putative phage morphogenesis protein [Ketogulonicigenium vulgare]
MAKKYVTGSEELEKRLGAMSAKMIAALKPALKRSVEDVAADAVALAQSHNRTGALVQSIEATGPNETTPAFASDGGSRTAGPTEAFVTVGSPDARHGHLVEFGTDTRQHADGTSTGEMPAAPFLLPAWRLNKPKVERRLRRAISTGAKKAVQDV